MSHFKKSVLLASLVLSSSIWAQDIRIKVETDYKSTFAVGYKVDGKDHGDLGTTYSGHGPANKKYTFGLRKDSFFGANMDCGTYVLSMDTSVKLIVSDNVCRAILG